MGIDRKEFLKVFGLGGAGLVLPGTSLMAGSELLSRPVKIYDNYIKVWSTMSWASA